MAAPAGPEGGRPPARKTLAPPSLARELRKKPALRSLLLTLLAARLARPASERCPIDLECYPGLPYHRHMLWKVALYAGARLVPYGAAGARNRPVLRLVWPDSTAAASSTATPPDRWWRGALNARADDESKGKLARAFAQAFGYELAVDPTTHRGMCVAKTDHLNGAHDGRVLACPVAAADPALAYQVLVDNRVGPDIVVDFRVPVVGGEIPFVYRKYRPMRDRFSNANTRVEVVAPGELLSPAEQAKLATVARLMGLELGGELDVLRDAGTGRLYVVDANWTSWGPPRPIARKDAVRAVRAYAAALAVLAAREQHKPV